jgi:hypothetical protein
MNIERAKQEAADAWHAFNSAEENRDYLLGYYQAKLNTLESLGATFASGELDSEGRYEFMVVPTFGKCTSCDSITSEDGYWRKHKPECSVDFPSS